MGSYVLLSEDPEQAPTLQGRQSYVRLEMSSGIRLREPLVSNQARHLPTNPNPPTKLNTKG